MLRRIVERVTADTETDSAADLVARLRPIYPRIAMFERQLSGERAQFYVYRDGRYEPDAPEDWWDQPGVPTADLDADTGRLTAVTSSWARLMRADAAELVGRHYLDFVLPEARDVARAMFEIVSEESDVRSEALVVRPDGTTVSIEFRAVRRDGDIEVQFRPIEA